MIKVVSATAFLFLFSSSFLLGSSHATLFHRKLVTVSPDIVIQRQYIVVLKDSVADVGAKASAMIRISGSGQVGFVYQSAMRGFVVKGLLQLVLYRILLDSEVDYVIQVRSSYRRRHHAFLLAHG